jgi:hypothetical protein
MESVTLQGSGDSLRILFVHIEYGKKPFPADRQPERDDCVSQTPGTSLSWKRFPGYGFRKVSVEPFGTLALAAFELAP